MIAAQRSRVRLVQKNLFEAFFVFFSCDLFLSIARMAHRQELNGIFLCERLVLELTPETHIFIIIA